MHLVQKLFFLSLLEKDRYSFLLNFELLILVLYFLLLLELHFDFHLDQEDRCLDPCSKLLLKDFHDSAWSLHEPEEVFGGFLTLIG